MSQRSEKINRRVRMAEERQDWLSARIAELESGLANLDTDRFTDGKSLMEQAKNLRHLKTDVADLRRACILRDIIVVCLIGLVIAGLFSVRAEVRATVGADDPVRPVRTIKAIETVAAQPIEPPLNTLENARITYYCPCAKCCGKSDGITSTGIQAQAGVTVSTDPAVIPTGSRVKIGDSWYIAQDTGVSGAAVDVFVEGHQEALKLGVVAKTVYWTEAIS